MADDQLRPLLDRLEGGLGRHGQAGHDPLDLPGRIAPEQAHVVPGFGQAAGANASSQRARSSTLVMASLLRVGALRPAHHGAGASGARGLEARPEARATGMIPRTAFVRNTSSASSRSPPTGPPRGSPARGKPPAPGPPAHDAGNDRPLQPGRPEGLVPDEEQIRPAPLPDASVRRREERLVRASRRASSNASRRDQ